MANTGKSGVHALLAAPRLSIKRRRAGRALLATAVVLGLGLAACSPALNWRSVALGDGTVSLPCKPDRAQRTVALGASPTPMEMVGCEADGALFAVSRVALASAADASRVQAQWQAASLLQMRSQSEPTANEASRAGSKALSLRVLSAVGQRGDGQPVQARLAWVVVGHDLFHLAVYAPVIAPDMSEPFFDGVTPP